MTDADTDFLAWLNDGPTPPTAPATDTLPADAPQPVETVATDKELMTRASGEIAPAHGGAKYSPDLARKLIEYVRAGNTITKACLTFDVTRQSLRAWSKKYPVFGKEFDKAREDGIDHLAESCLEAIQTAASPHLARVILDATKWLCSVGRPRKYSERLMMDIQQSIDVRGAVELAEARRRAMLERTPIDVEVVEENED